MLALALAACGGDDDKEPVDSGSNADASTSVDSGAHDASASQDGGGSEDASANMDSGSSDAGKDASSDTGISDAAMDAGKSLAFAQGGKISALDAATSDASGAALLVRVDGGSLVSLQVSGLNPSTMYPAHVHNLPCAQQAGGHYQHVMDGGVNATNEVWPTLMTDDAGQGRSFVSVDKVLREDAVAIVVHDQAAPNPKLLCADLISTSLTALTTTGTPVAFASAPADAGIANISGSGSITRANDGTTKAGISLQNLQPNTGYMVHVHDQPCGFASAGGHYKIDYGIATAEATNEIWLNFTSNDAGAGGNDASINHVARAEAQSIVIHSMAGTKLACIDLKP